MFLAMPIISSFNNFNYKITKEYLLTFIKEEKVLIGQNNNTKELKEYS